MEGEEAAAKGMCVVICVTKPATAQPQPGPETVNPATPAAKEKKDADDSDSSGTQHVESQDEVEEEEEVCEEPSEEIVEDAAEPDVGYRWDKLTNDDKGRFENVVTLLASRAAACT